MDTMTRADTVRDAETECATCGWRSKPTTPGMAAYGLIRHSCTKRLREQQTSQRYRERMATVDHTPKACQHKVAGHQHGTYACYTLDNCRCLPCSNASSLYEQKRVRAHAYGTWSGLVDADPARQHVQRLQAAGMGLKRIVQLSGISSGGMTKLIYGTQSRPPAQRVTPSTAQRILAVPMPTPADLSPSTTIASIGTRRRIQALIRVGWSPPRLAELAGIDIQRIYGAMDRQLTLAQTHVAIARLYDQLWNQPPPETNQRERIAASRSRNRALAAGWAAPLDWDDDTIDLPDGQPSVVTNERLAPEELVAEVLQIRESTDDLAVVAKRMGMTSSALDQALRRAGRGDLLRVAS